MVEMHTGQINKSEHALAAKCTISIICKSAQSFYLAGQLSLLHSEGSPDLKKNVQENAECNDQQNPATPSQIKQELLCFFKQTQNTELQKNECLSS